MVSALGYLIVAILSAIGGFLGGWLTSGARISELERRIAAAETAISRQVEMIERLVAALTNIIVVADAGSAPDDGQTIAALARNALRG